MRKQNKSESPLDALVAKVRAADNHLAESKSKFAQICDEAKAAVKELGETVETVVDCVVQNVDLFHTDFPGCKTVSVASAKGGFIVNKELRSIALDRITNYPHIRIDLNYLRECSIKGALAYLDGLELLPNHPHLANAKFWLEVEKETRYVRERTKSIMELLTFALKEGLMAREDAERELRGISPRE